MGLFSWINNKIIEHKYNKGIELCEEKSFNDAIEIFKDILNEHPSAPSALLDTFHKKLLSQPSNKSIVREIVFLYKSHEKLGTECIAFAQNHLFRSNRRLCIYYSAELYNNGIKQIKPVFISCSEQLVLQNINIIHLSEISPYQTLLSDLARQLYKELEQKYKNKDNDIADAFRIANLIYPYIQDLEFIELYLNIKFDIFVSNSINDQTIHNYDDLLKDVSNKLSTEGKERFLKRTYKLTTQLFSHKWYFGSLLLSSRILKYYDVKSIYVDSAFALYSSHSNFVSVIDDKVLYSSLGEGRNFIKALERFVPYSNYADKYVDYVCQYVNSLENSTLEESLTILKEAWLVQPNTKYFTTVSKKRLPTLTGDFINELINNITTFFKTNNQLHIFVQVVCELEDKKNVVDILEKLISSGKDLTERYVEQVLVLINKTSSKDKFSIINKALTYVEDHRFYDTKVSLCWSYIAQGSRLYNKIETQSLSLVGKHPEAEILLTQLAVNRFIECNDDKQKICYIKKAISYSLNHNELFNQAIYENMRHGITKLANDLANDLFTKGANDEAIDLLYFLRDYKFEWFNTYGKHVLAEITKLSFCDAINKLRSVIIEGKESKGQILIDLWESYMDIIEKNGSVLDFDDRISFYIASLVFIQSQCNIKEQIVYTEQLANKLDDIYFDKAIDIEKNCKYAEAIESFSNIKAYRKDNYDVLCRISICRLKSKTKLSSSHIALINSLLKEDKDLNCQKDLAYRWCLLLARNKDYNEVKDINLRILHTDSQLEELCENIILKDQNNKLSKLNKILTKMNAGELAAQDAIKLGKGLSTTLSKLDRVINISSTSKTKMRDAIRNYALNQFYKQGEFVNCLRGLQNFDSSYLSDPLNLRNIAVMCLNAAEAGQLTETNYKELLAIWATVIYQPMLFVKSLDYTSWDDQYTFSLANVFGLIDDNIELPDNINYSDEISTSIVSIREVQSSLISRMEAALKENNEHLLFFNSQLEAMEELSQQQLDIPCVIVAPYLLQLSSIYSHSVKHSLETEESAHYGNWESILKIGNLYGLSNGYFSKYAEALSCLNRATEALNKNLNIRQGFSKKNIEAIRPFNNLFATLVSTATTKLNVAINNKLSYTDIRKGFGQICIVLNNDNFSFIFSNYINKSVVKEMNDKTLKLAEGVNILFDIYPYCKCNPHLKRNIDNIVEFLIRNYLTGREENNIDVIVSFLSTTRDFDDKVVSAFSTLLNGGNTQEEKALLTMILIANEDKLENLKRRLSNKSSKISKALNETSLKIQSIKIDIELSGIMDGVHDGSIEKYIALEKVYDIYKKHKDNKHVCENLAILINDCIMDYIIEDKLEKQRVTKVLDDLMFNQSDTFTQNKSLIGKAYNAIWNSLPPKIRIILQLDIKNLTPQGLALKKGLEYLKQLK